MARSVTLTGCSSALRSLRNPAPRLHLEQRASISQIDLLQKYGVDFKNVLKLRGIRIKQPHETEMTAADSEILSTTRAPRNVQAIYLAPLRRSPTHGIPVCDLQLRSYSIRNLELFADFAMRAAYYLGLPASGPVPLPRITERFTVPRGNFIHKKSQENFERVTLRRMIQIKDGHAEAVQVWLGYLQKKQYHGVGMKANVFEHESVGVGREMEADVERAREEMAGRWENTGRRVAMPKDKEVRERVEEILARGPYRRALDELPEQE